MGSSSGRSHQDGRELIAVPTPPDTKLLELATALAASGTVADTIHELVTFAVESTGTAFGGVTMLQAGGRRFTTLGATDPRVVQADHLQYELREGPCLGAAVTMKSVYSDALESDARWPLWGPAAAKLGFHSVVSAEIHGRGQRIGALNLYGRAPAQFNHADLDLAQLFATQAAVALVNMRNEDALREALDTRTLIGQAQGILMERFGISPDQAFSVLRRYSQQSNRRVRDIVAEIVATRALPGTAPSIDEQ